MRFVEFTVPKPTYAKVYTSKGLEFERHGELKKAIDSYEKAIFHNPSYPNSFYQLGLIYEKLGKYDLMIDHFKRVVEIGPDFEKIQTQLMISDVKKDLMYAKACLEMGRLFLQQKDLKRSIEHLELAAGYSGVPEAYYLLGMAYVHADNEKKAEEQMQILFDIGYHPVGYKLQSHFPKEWLIVE